MMNNKLRFIVRKILQIAACFTLFCSQCFSPQTSQATETANIKENNVREAFFAKQGWYPENQQQLELMLEKEFSTTTDTDKLPNKITANHIQGIISPHAGYVYCLETAAHAWRHLINRQTERVFVLGPSHRAFTDKAVLCDYQALKTPLGKLSVATTTNRQLLQKFPQLFTANNRLHDVEHSIEIQLPLIHKTLGAVQLIPIIMPHGDLELLKKIGTAIGELLTAQDLIVMSSDLSHFPTQKAAAEVDQDAMNSWLSLNPDIIYQTEEKWQNSPKTSTAMCGVSAIVVGINALNKAFGQGELQTLNMHHSDSGVTSGDTSRVVGYGSALVITKKGETMPETSANMKQDIKKNTAKQADSEQASDEQVSNVQADSEQANNKQAGNVQADDKQTDDTTQLFSLSARQQMLTIARQTLEQKLAGKKVSIDNPNLAELEKSGYGIFVTMKNNAQLRGCIGVFSSDKPLWKLVSEFAIASSQDQRFSSNPVTVKELPEIDFEISILSPLRQISSYQEAKLGVHGIVIEKGWNRGVFLPQVATETGWNLEEFWGYLCRDKAGLPMNIYEKPDAMTKLFVFSAEVFGEKNN